MKVVSSNCRGLGNQPAVRGLHDLQKAEEPDLLFLCETKLTEEEMDRFVGA
jgi:exonuclease III